MPPQKSLHPNLDCFAQLCRNLFLAQRDCYCRVTTSSTANENVTIFLHVQIKHRFSSNPQGFGIQISRAIQSGFLLYCKQRLDRRESLGFVCSEKCKRCCTSHAIIGPKRCALGSEPQLVVVALCQPLENDGIGIKVVLRVLVLLRHHVNVPLNNHRLGIFSAARTGTEHAEIALGILRPAQPVGFGKSLHVRQHRLLLARRAGNRRQRRKMRPNFGRR